MQNLRERNEANSVDPVVGETVYVNEHKCRGVIIEVVTKYNQTSYKIDMEDGLISIRLRREIVRVIQ